MISSLPPHPLSFSPELLQPLPLRNLCSLYPFTLLRKRCPALLSCPAARTAFLPAVSHSPVLCHGSHPAANPCAGDCISTCDLQENLFPLKCSIHGNSLSWKRSLQRSGRCCRCCCRVAPLCLQLQIHRTAYKHQEGWKDVCCPLLPRTWLGGELGNAERLVQSQKEKRRDKKKEELLQPGMQQMSQ